MPPHKKRAKYAGGLSTVSGDLEVNRGNGVAGGRPAPDGRGLPNHPLTGPSAFKVSPRSKCVWLVRFVCKSSSK